MSLALAFWILLLLWLVLNGLALRTGGMAAIAESIIPWLLFLLLGWSVFGAPLHG